MMKDQLVVGVLEFKKDDEYLAEKQVTEPTVYDDGTVEIRVTLAAPEHVVFVRLSVSDLVGIGMTSETREEAP